MLSLIYIHLHEMTGLLRALSLKQPYEPKPRLWHNAGAVRGECFISAGRTTDFDKTKEELSSTVEVFDQYLEQWRQLKTTGSPPVGFYNGGCCVSPNGDLFAYAGGTGGSASCGGLYKLSFLKWSWLSMQSDAKSPGNKHACAIICFNKKKVAVIGGYGPPPASLQPGATFIKDKRYTNGEGWTNEVHIFDTDQCEQFLPSSYSIAMPYNINCPQLLSTEFTGYFTEVSERSCMGTPRMLISHLKFVQYVFADCLIDNFVYKLTIQSVLPTYM